MVQGNAAQLAEIIESLNDAVFILSREGNIVDANSTAHERLGYSREELLSMHIARLDPPEFAKREPERLREVREKGSAIFESAHLRKDGTIMPVEISSRLIDHRGRKAYLVVARDITERKQARKHLEESEEKYQKLFNNEIDAICIFEIDSKRLIDVNDAFLRLYGYSREEALRLRVEDVSAEPDKSREAIHKSAAGGDTLIPIRKHRKKDGTVFFVELSAGPFTWRGERVMFSVLRDITSRLEAQWALQASEKKYRSFVENLNGIAYRSGAETWTPEFFHGRVEEITGYREEDFVAGRPRWDQIVHPDDFGPLPGKEELASIPGYSCAREYRIVRKDGTVRWVAEHAQNTGVDAHGTPFIHGVILDVTGRRLAQEALRESEEYIKNILDTVDEGIVVIDRDYRIMSANRAYAEQVGRSEGEIVGRHCFEVSHAANRPCLEEAEDCAVRKVFETGEPHTAVHRHPGRGGRTLFVETKAFPVKDGSGRVTSAIESINDITEKQLLVEERLKTQKLESIGTLAGGVAHDFNNLLQGVFGHISMARVSIDRREAALAMIEQAEEALLRTVGLTNQLLTFAKGGKPVTEPFPVLPVVENAVRFALSGSSCEYEIQPQSDLWQVNGDAGQTGQVIQNIALNAGQAVPLAGRIRITLRNVPAGGARPTALEAGDFVMISIRDNGVGIPEKNRERIFDPYFTTKAGGSGLGLATSYSIVRNHRGLIDLESRPGEGATFTIYLPAAREKAARPSAAAALVEIPHAKVLVMDDEEMVRKVAERMIHALGHTCGLAETGEAAVAMFKAARDEGSPFDMVILDLTIRGGMGGIETLRELLAIDPEVKAVVSSGYSDDDALSNYRDRGFRMFLKKPYNLEKLRAAINTLLA